jgi:glycerate kinase
MKVLVAPDKFKGSLSATEVAGAISRGFRRAIPGVELDLAPIADGGEGFAAALHSAVAVGGGEGEDVEPRPGEMQDAEWVNVTVRDPLGRLVEGRYVRLRSSGVAVMDMSEASGLWRVSETERAPLDSSTFGTGELIRHAAESGASMILVGLGGSATNDGGAGMAAALGYRFLDANGQVLEVVPRNLPRLAVIEAPVWAGMGWEMPPVVAACDVRNPLLGERGASRVFGPQKGATPGDVEFLEAALERLAEVVKGSLGGDHREAAGAGAAGGIGFGLLNFCRARLRSGFTVVAEALRLDERMAACDLVVTGEGRLDCQTLEGKGPAGIALMARGLSKPVLALAGSISGDAEAIFDMALPIVDRPVSLEEAMRRGEEFLELAAYRAARIISQSRGL